MYDIYCIGHLTNDKVVTTRFAQYMPGGTAYYFSCALSKLPLKYLLATAVAPAEMKYVNALQQKGIEVMVQPSAHTVFFENLYGENPDQRQQNVLQQADQFTAAQFEAVNARLFHLGPLLPGDISVDLIKTLAAKAPVSLDVQGYLRKVENKKVYAAEWPEKKEALPYISILKTDVGELQTLSGYPDVETGVKVLADWGVKEIVVTNGSHGSQIFRDGASYSIPAYIPPVIADTTGCGDTYIAGYLYQRILGVDIINAGRFAAAMAGLKTAVPGAFAGTLADIQRFMKG